MNIFELIKKYGTQEQCIKLLEKSRWGNTPTCPYCESEKVGRHKEKSRQSRWQCSSCKKSYSVTVGTIFHRTHLGLPEWFAILRLMLNAKKSLSSYQISRDIGIRQPTVLSVQNRIREAMATDQGQLLKGIVEMDETYIGGKPRYKGKSKRGRGTDKMAVMGAVERGGKVVAKPAAENKLSFKILSGFVKENIDTKQAELVTDEYRGYSGMTVVLPHSVINHSIAFSFKGVHTNSIEGFWSLLKRAWYGQHHHYSRVKSHLYIGEPCYKYNNRENDNTFYDMIKNLLFNQR